MGEKRRQGERRERERTVEREGGLRDWERKLVRGRERIDGERERGGGMSEWGRKKIDGERGGERERRRGELEEARVGEERERDGGGRRRKIQEMCYLF